MRGDEETKVDAHADRGDEAAVGGRPSGAQVEDRQGEGEEARYQKAVAFLRAHFDYDWRYPISENWARLALENTLAILRTGEPADKSLVESP